MSVFSQSGMTPYASESSTESGSKIHVHLNHGGTTATPRQDVTLDLVFSNPTNSPFDVTKTYTVTIDEEA